MEVFIITNITEAVSSWINVYIFSWIMEAVVRKPAKAAQACLTTMRQSIYKLSLEYSLFLSQLLLIGDKVADRTQWTTDLSNPHPPLERFFFVPCGVLLQPSGNFASSARFISRLQRSGGYSVFSSLILTLTLKLCFSNIFCSKSDPAHAAQTL